MNLNFDTCLRLLLAPDREGGFSNDPNDPGGLTNHGVTAAVWSRWADVNADEATMRALTPEDVAPLYKQLYWDEVCGDELPDGMDHCVFDAAVNMGTTHAVKILQQVANTRVDGEMGPNTLEGVHRADEHLLIGAYSDARKRMYKTYAQFPRYGKGWLARVDAVEMEANRMLA